MVTTGTNNLDVPLWTTILFWTVTVIMFVFTFITTQLMSGRGTLLLTKYFKKSYFILKGMSYVSLFFFPVVSIWMYTMFVMVQSKTLFTVT